MDVKSAEVEHLMKRIIGISRWKALLKSWKALLLYAFDYKEKAIVEFEECLRLEPQNALNLRTLGTILINKGDYTKGIENLKKTLQYLPSYDKSLPETYAYVAYGYSELNRLGDAISYYQKAINSWVKDGEFKRIDLYYNLGRIYLQKGNYPEAISTFKNGIDFENADARAHFGLGIAYYEIGHEESSLQHFEKAIRLDPSLKDDETMRKLVTVSKALSELVHLRRPDQS